VYFDNTESLEVRKKNPISNMHCYFPETAAPQTAYRSSIPETFCISVVRVDLENDRNLLICTAHHTIRILCHIVLVQNAIASWDKGLVVTIRQNA
jgi:hypothetical protein